MERLQVEDRRTSRDSQELERIRKELLDTQGQQARVAAEIKSGEESMAHIQNPQERAGLENQLKQMELPLEQLAGLGAAAARSRG